MRLVQFTSVPNPDIDGGQASTLIVDAERVVYVERSTVTHMRIGADEQYRGLLQSLYDELDRVHGVVKGCQLKVMDIQIENPAAMRQWHTIHSAADDLKVAYSLMNSCKGPWTHPPKVCTTIGLAYGNDSGTGALARLHVAETVDQVHEKLGRYLLPDH